MANELHRKVAEGGSAGERRAAEWLKNRGFKIIKAHTRPHIGIDIEAERKGVRWVIEVKSQVSDKGGKPKVDINGLIEMTRVKGAKKIGLLFMPKGRGKDPLLFELSKMSLAALKAWKQIRKGLD